jgi:predicted dehydrogenase
MKKVAVVGFGFMGMTHASHLLNLKGVKLNAIVDQDLKGIDAKLASKTGNFSTGGIDPKALARIQKFSSLGECLEKSDIDAVHICVHTDLHAELATQAMNAGKNVFLEKPMTLEVQKGEALIALANKKGLLFMVGHVLRFMPPYRLLKQWIDSREFGKLTFLSMTRFSGLPAWGQWKEKRKDFGSSGGALFDLLIHDIDFTNYLFGSPDAIESRMMPGALSNYDFIDAWWTYNATGLKVKLEGGNVFQTAYPFQAGYMANFENASIQFSTLFPDVIKIAEGENLREVPASDGSDGFFNEIEYFHQCLHHGAAPIECMPQSSLETIKLCYRHNEV